LLFITSIILHLIISLYSGVCSDRYRITVEAIIIQKITPSNKMERVSPTVQVLSRNTIPLGMLVYENLADIVFIESLLIVLRALVPKVSRKMKGQEVLKYRCFLQVSDTQKNHRPSMSLYSHASSCYSRILISMVGRNNDEQNIR